MVQLSELIPAGAVTGTGLALQHRGRYLFMLAGMRHHLGGESTFYAGIGGHREPGESWPACAAREALEELGCEVKIRPAGHTAFISRDSTVRPVTVGDEPRPLCVYELWEPPDAPWNKRGEGFSYYIVVYEAGLDDAVEPHPRDVDGVLWLTPEQVLRTAQAPMLLQDLLAGGATLAAREPFPGHWSVRPFGTAQALAILWGLDYAHADTT